MSKPSEFDGKSFRRALGSFATGVTVVTARDSNGIDVGMTANSFNSVSLSPPMVLWSLDKKSSSLHAFMATDHFAVHILSADQESVSNQFAKSGLDRFAGIKASRGLGDVQMLDGCSARFSCKTTYRYEGGDHIIIVGEVLAFDSFDRPPLVFQGGRYGLALRKNDESADSISSFGIDWLGFLLRRAYDQVFTPVRAHVRQRGLDDVHYHILTILGMGDGRSRDEMIHLIEFTGLDTTYEHFEELRARNLIDINEVAIPDSVHLTTGGRALAIELLATGKSAETVSFRGLDFNESRMLKSLLNRVICNTAETLPESWRKENYWLENNIFGAPTARSRALP